MTPGIYEALMLVVMTAVWSFLLYRFIKRAKMFKDYVRIVDYMAIGTLIWLFGLLHNDFSVQTVGCGLWMYGFAILLYNEYKRGYEESKT